MASKDKDDKPVEMNDALIERIQAMPELNTDTAEKIANRITERIFAATSLEEMLTPQVVLSAKDILGKPIVISDVHYNESTFEEGPAVYAIVDAVLNGQGVTISCGARTAMAMLFKAKAEGWLPFAAKFVQSANQTAAGFRPMWLEAVPDSEAEATLAQEDEEPF